MTFGDMSRSHSKLSAPPNGIVSSQRAKSWVGKTWFDLLAQYGASHGKRVARGRSLARGRVCSLWFSPGFADAEVYDREVERATLRVSSFSEAEWDTILDVLVSDLRHLAHLIQGQLTSGLNEALLAKGISLMPRIHELDGDCTCGDFDIPCAHLCAVHTVLADAIDGEPFLLFTLRGRTRPQIMNLLRKKWNDEQRAVEDTNTTCDVPEIDAIDDWYNSPTPLSKMSFGFGPAPTPAAGLKALGPPPGDDNLTLALEPLFEAGSQAARDIALKEAPEGPDRARGKPGGRRHNVGIVSASTRLTAQPTEERADITELLVNLLAEMQPVSSTKLSKLLGAERLTIRNELLELEKLGIVYRTGATRGTRWHLG